MPHIPRRTPGGLTDPSTLPRAPARTTASKPAVPYLGDKAAEPRKTRQLIGKLNMKEWDVSPLKVFKAFFDKELHVDEHSGLVSYTRHGTH